MRYLLAGLLLMSGCDLPTNDTVAGTLGQVTAPSSVNPCMDDARRFINVWRDILQKDGVLFTSPSSFAWQPPESAWVMMVTAVLQMPDRTLYAGSFGGYCNPKTQQYERLPAFHPTGGMGPIDPNLYSAPKT